MGMRGREKKLHEQKIEDILKFEDKTRRENGEGKWERERDKNKNT